MQRSTYSIVNKTQLPPATIAVAGALLAIFGLGPNSLLTLCAIGVLLLGAWLLWRPAESPILLFVFCIQWLQASIKIFNANWLNEDVGALAFFGGDVRGAILLSLLGLIALAIGMRLGSGPWRPQDGLAIRIHGFGTPTEGLVQTLLRCFSCSLLRTKFRLGCSWPLTTIVGARESQMGILLDARLCDFYAWEN